MRFGHWVLRRIYLKIIKTKVYLIKIILTGGINL